MSRTIEVSKTVATEYHRLNGEIERLKGALQVIHTWASYDIKTNAGTIALIPEHVVKLCNVALNRSAAKEGRK